MPGEFDTAIFLKEAGSTALFSAAIGAGYDMLTGQQPGVGLVASGGATAAATFVGESIHTLLLTNMGNTGLGEGLAPLLAPASVGAVTVAMDRFTPYGNRDRSAVNGALKGAVCDLGGRYIAQSYIATGGQFEQMK